MCTQNANSGVSLVIFDLDALDDEDRMVKAIYGSPRFHVVPHGSIYFHVLMMRTRRGWVIEEVAIYGSTHQLPLPLGQLDFSEPHACLSTGLAFG